MKKIEHNNYIYYILTCILIFSTDTFIVATNQNRNIFYCSLLVLIVSLIYMLYGNLKFSIRNITMLVTLITTISLNMLSHQDISNGNIYKMLLLCYGMIGCTFMEFSKFCIAYSKIMLVVCLFSLLTYTLSFFITFSEYFPVITNVMGTQVAFVGLSNIPINITDSIIRNYGPFWEPGVYAIYLCIALIFTLKEIQAQIPMSAYILAIGILTTLSPTGVILLVLVLVSHLLLGKITLKKCLNINQINILLIFICCTIVFLSNETVYDMIFAKLSTENWKYASTLSRLHSAYANIIIFLDNPLLGCGINKYVEILLSYYESHADLSFIRGNVGTNGLLIQFAMYGGIIGAVYLYGLFAFCGAITQTLSVRYILFIVFILMLCAEPLQLSLMFNTVIFWKHTKRETVHLTTMNGNNI